MRPRLPRLARASSALSTPAPAPAPRRPFTFHIGASFAGKQLDAETLRARRRHADFAHGGPIALWRDETLSRAKAVRSNHAGEDFFFVQPMRGASGVALGVADGVGGWVSAGVDPSKFSQALMYHAHRYAKTSWAGEPESDPTLESTEPVEGWELTPFDCIELAHGAVLRERTVVAGSSTACVLTLNARSGLLRAANLGDSGFLLVRGAAVLHHQAPQTRFFNCPRQLAKLPGLPQVDAQSFSDSPRMADAWSTSLRGGDIIIAYTDGVSDNVFPSEMVTICSLVTRSGAPEDEQAQDMADRLVEYSLQCMSKKTRVSPFERAAARAGKFWPGGKPDDTTAVVALVSEDA